MHMWISTLIEKWNIKDDMIFIISFLVYYTWTILKEWSQAAIPDYTLGLTLKLKLELEGATPG